jgi:hypothetical protein
MVNQVVRFDAVKKIKGRKWVTTVDTLGLFFRVFVTAAEVPERAGGKQVLQNVNPMGHGLLSMDCTGGVAIEINARLCVTQKALGGGADLCLAGGLSTIGPIL